MKSAKTIKQANEPLKGEDLTNFNNCIKTTKTPQLQETEQVLIDGQMKTLKLQRNAMTTLTQSKLACHQCNLDFFEETFMSKIFCQTCKQIRTEDDLTQCAVACSLIKKGFTKGGDGIGDFIMVDDADMDDSEFLLTCHTVCLLKSHKPTLADKLIESHNRVADIPDEYPVSYISRIHGEKTPQIYSSCFIFSPFDLCQISKEKEPEVKATRSQMCLNHQHLDPCQPGQYATPSSQ